MAKKKKKYLIKLNNKIRNYFNGQPFDDSKHEENLPLAAFIDVNSTKITEEKVLNKLGYFVSDRESTCGTMINTKKIASKNTGGADEDIIKIVQGSAYLFDYITLSYKKIQP